MPLSLLTLNFDAPSQTIQVALPNGPSAAVTLPTFQIEGQPSGPYTLRHTSEIDILANGAHQQTWTFESLPFPALALNLVWRGFPHSPVLRFNYQLIASQPLHLTKPGGVDAITYLSLTAPALDQLSLTEIQLSHFDPVAHSYMPYRQDYAPAELQPGQTLVGPIAIFHGDNTSLLLAYEHGADAPNSFLQFEIHDQPDQRSLALTAVKGNYYDGQTLQPDAIWSSVWFDLALYPAGLEAFLPVYRRFFLDEVCINPQSRRPYIFYNTWNYQERNKYFRGQPYLHSMRAGRILPEIDVAHRLGVDVFVIDAGWFLKTGDWQVNLERFPEGLRDVKRKLDEYGMKLGLWFNPTVAALTSRLYQEHPEYEMTLDGKPRWRGPVWETEESTSMCLASGYAEHFVDTLVRLHHELGVSYFKWDAISQYGCDLPLHFHGAAANAPHERAECYAYQSGRAMIHIVEELSRRCPDVIVDFDVTEGGRFVGLGFLSVGKYFLINNGIS